MMRWGWGAAGLVLLMGWGLALWGQAPRLEVTRHSVAGRPLEAAPIRVLQLSDLHLRPEPDWNAAVSKAVRDIDADLIVLTGDMIDRPEALPELIAFLAGLGQVPKFAVLGNWEHWSGVDLLALKSGLAQVQTTLLVNEMHVVHIRGRALRMVGLDDGTASQPDADLLGLADGNTVVLQHSPGWFLSPEAQRSRWKAALCLSGHTHGGQIAPLGQAIWTPRGSGPFVGGFYQLDACPLYVSRGVGTSVIPVRLGARAELAVFEW